MLAHKVQKSNLGIFGFDTINIFTNDEIFCSGFTPDEDQIEAIGDLISSLNRLTYSKNPICLYVNRKNGIFWMDLKLFCLGDPVFADSQNTGFTGALESIQNKILEQIPIHAVHNIDANDVAVLYN